MAKKSPKKRVWFKLEAPQASEVFLAGSFNGWDPALRPLKQNAKGVWSARLSLEPGSHEYRFWVDGQWQDDPACQERQQNEFGTYNCVIHV